MLERIRTVLVVMEEGSINRAANRLGLSQPTLTRQIQSLEAELGGALFDRDSRGVRPTDLAFRMRESMLPVLKDFDKAHAELTAHAQGRKNQLRVGFLGLSASRFLNPVLEKFRATHPDVQLWLFDQTPREQLDALRKGELDLALIGQEGAETGDEFYQQRISRVGVVAVLPSDHSFANRESISISELSKENFIAPLETVVPGRKKWMEALCREAGFRPRFLIGTETVTETFARVTGEPCVSLLPDYLDNSPPPGIALVSVSDRFAYWDFSLLRQRGKISPACRDLIRWMREEI